MSLPRALATHTAVLPTISLSFRKVWVYRSLPGTFCHILADDRQWLLRSQQACPDFSLLCRMAMIVGVLQLHPTTQCHLDSFLPFPTNSWPARAVLASTHDGGPEWGGWAWAFHKQSCNKDHRREAGAWQGLLSSSSQLPLCGSHTQVLGTFPFKQAGV